MSADSGNDQQLEHYVSEAPFDPRSVEALSPEQERYYMASQWQLMWWKFIRHRLALISGGFLLLMYGSILISEFLAPVQSTHPKYKRDFRAAAIRTFLPRGRV